MASIIGRRRCGDEEHSAAPLTLARMSGSTAYGADVRGEAFLTACKATASATVTATSRSADAGGEGRAGFRRAGEASASARGRRPSSCRR